MAKTLRLPPGMTLDQFVVAEPDKPLPNISGFDTLEAQGTFDQVRRLNDWIEPQRTCGIIIKHHGRDGLTRVLKGIARASAKLKVPMRGRVRAVAGYYGLA